MWQMVLNQTKQIRTNRHKDRRISKHMVGTIISTLLLGRDTEEQRDRMTTLK